MKVGIFDSGIGGLSVLHCAKKLIPDTDFIYYADEEHVPYGEKKPEEVRRYLFDIFSFMLKRNVDAIVIACNTATSVLTMEYRRQFPIPIIGMEPAVKRAVDLYAEENKRILVAATPITINGMKLKNLVEKCDANNEIDKIALPGLVRFAEKGNFSDPSIQDYIKNELKAYDIAKYGTLVLGCTHFNYFKDSFRNVFGSHIHFIDGNTGTIKQLIRVLTKKETAITLESTIETEAEGSMKAAIRQAETQYYMSGRLANEDEQQRIANYMVQLEKVYNIN